MSTVEQNTVIVVNLNQQAGTNSLVTELHKRHFIAHESVDLDLALHACQRCESAHLVLVCVSFDIETLSAALQNNASEQLKTIIVYTQHSTISNTDSIRGIPLVIIKQDTGYAAILRHLSDYTSSQEEIILSTIKEAIIGLDQQQRVQYLNPAALQLLGLTKSEVSGQAIDQVLELHDLISNKALTFNDIKQQNPQGESPSLKEKSLYASLKNHSGKQYKLAIRLYEQQSSFIYVLVLRDITEKYTPLPKIQASENKYWALVNTTQLGYTILDKQGRVIDANGEFIRITGHDKLEDILGVDARTWMSNLGRTNLFQAIDELIKTGRIVGIEIDFKGSNGLITPIEFNATIIKEDGEYYVLGIGRDISERRRTEKEKEMIQTQLRQAQKMEAIGQLTGGIAHDFNNVLASILGYTELSQQLFITA
ncbi:MAG TPA: PAS domain S-box protein, partial [Pseudomonadales bacterium]|nr:PAS domain S-box protein [Pseudomonadales bacterium]